MFCACICIDVVSIPYNDNANNNAANMITKFKRI